MDNHATTTTNNTVDLRSFKCGWLTKEQATSINSDLRVLKRFADGLPKAELHLHLEGTLEPALQLALAKRNGLTQDKKWCEENGYTNSDQEWLDQERERRQFDDLEQFLRLYYSACAVLKTEQDFYDMAWAYFERASHQNIRHCEVFFDPQTHIIEIQQLPLDTVMNGLHRACQDASKLLDPPVDAHLIMCFLRHRHPQSDVLRRTPSLPPAEPNEALTVLKQVIDGGHLNKIIGVGLDSTEVGNAADLFVDAFQLAREHGLRCVAHAGEEGPASNVVDALDLLNVSRIDHGVRCLEDPAIIRRLAMSGTPLTVCPCSNHQLQVNRRFFGGENPVRQLLEAGLKITINSDDPAYFFGHFDKFGEQHDGYVDACYYVTAKEVGLSADELVMLSLNSFEASFITPDQLMQYKALLRKYCDEFEV